MGEHGFLFAPKKRQQKNSIEKLFGRVSVLSAHNTFNNSYTYCAYFILLKCPNRIILE